MIAVRSVWVAVIALTLAAPLGALASGCGGTRLLPSEAPAPLPKPRNAAEIARDVVHARVGALIYVERLRGRPVLEKIASLELFRPFLEGTGIRPEVDIDRAFVAASATHRADESIVVVEHRLANERVRSALDFLFTTQRLNGAFFDPPGSVPMARVEARGQTRVLALIEPNFLIVLPEAHALEAARFIGTGGFPDPTGTEVIAASAIDPSSSVRGPRVPPLPPTIQSAALSVTLADDGGVDVAATAQSTSAEQATVDAAEIAQRVDEATSIKVAFVRLRVFKPIPVFAEGDRVLSKVHLTEGEIDTLFGALVMMLPR